MADPDKNITQREARDIADAIDRWDRGRTRDAIDDLGEVVARVEAEAEVEQQAEHEAEDRTEQ